MKYKFKLSAMVELGIGMVVAASLLLAGCGGGGGGSGGSATAASTLSGVAAVGAPIVAGTINISCAAGSALAPTTTSSMGAWQVTLSGQTLPCAVQVSGGTINAVANTLLYHSIATAPGTVNVTPLTELMVANLAGTATPSIWFAGLNATPTQLAAITQTQVNTALTNLRTALSGLTPLSTINPITTAFTPTSGNVSDDMLVALKVAMANTGVTYTALLSNASVPAFTAPVTGFGTALTTAYAGTTSGGIGAGAGGGGTTGGGVGRAYATDIFGKVSVVDTTSNTIIATVAVGNGPVNSVAVHPTANRVYVANPNNNTVAVIDMTSNTVVATVAVGVQPGAYPNGVAVHPTANRIYVANAGSNTVSVIDTTNNTVVATVGVGIYPSGVAVNFVTNRAYVTNLLSNTVSVIDTTSNTVVATVPVGWGPLGVAVHPTANRAYVTDGGSGNTATVSVIDTTTNTVVTTVVGGSYGVAVNPITNRAYATHMSGFSILVIDTTTNTAIATITGISNPGNVAVNSITNRAYVNTLYSSLSVIDTTTNTVVATVAGWFTGVAVVP